MDNYQCNTCISKRNHTDYFKSLAFGCFSFINEEWLEGLRISYPYLRMEWGFLPFSTYIFLSGRSACQGSLERTCLPLRRFACA